MIPLIATSQNAPRSDPHYLAESDAEERAVPQIIGLRTLDTLNTVCTPKASRSHKN